MKWLMWLLDVGEHGALHNGPNHPATRLATARIHRDLIPFPPDFSCISHLLSSKRFHPTALSSQYGEKKRLAAGITKHFRTDYSAIIGSWSLRSSDLWILSVSWKTGNKFKNGGGYWEIWSKI